MSKVSKITGYIFGILFYASSIIATIYIASINTIKDTLDYEIASGQKGQKIVNFLNRIGYSIDFSDEMKQIETAEIMSYVFIGLAVLFLIGMVACMIISAKSKKEVVDVLPYSPPQDNYTPSYPVNMPQKAPPTRGSGSDIMVGCVYCTSGVYAGGPFEIRNNEEIVIGRDSSRCNIVLSENDISSVHLTIQYNGVNKQYKVIDNSTNGTFANGQPLKRGAMYMFGAGTTLILTSNSQNAFTLK